MFEPLLAEGIIARGIKQGLLEVRVWDLRDFASDKHRSTDDEAYGGGPGMVMFAEPVLRAVEKLNFEFRVSNEELRSEYEPHIIMTAPQGRTFSQSIAKELANKQWL